MGLDLLGDAALGVTVIHAILKGDIDLRAQSALLSNEEFTRLCIGSGLYSVGQPLACNANIRKASDMFEAICGAVFLDGGLGAVREVYARIAAHYGQYQERYTAACSDSQPFFPASEEQINYSGAGQPLVLTKEIADQIMSVAKPSRLAALGHKVIRLWALDELTYGPKWPTHASAHTHAMYRSGLTWQREVAAKMAIHQAFTQLGYKLEKEAGFARFRVLVANAYLRGDWQLCTQVLNSARCHLEPQGGTETSADAKSMSADLNNLKLPQTNLPQHDFVRELEALLQLANTFSPKYETFPTKIWGGRDWFRCRLKIGREVFSEGSGSTAQAAQQHTAEALVDKILSGDGPLLPLHGGGKCR
jgi:dsRNA-specific ribonuclease